MFEVEFKRETEHASAIIDGKLYRTNDAEIIGHQGNKTYFRTLKGNYFSAFSKSDGYQTLTGCVCRTCYYGISIETEDKAKEVLGLLNIDRYMELFGHVEKA